VELSIVESVSHETIRRTLKKNGMTKRKLQYWVIPPKANAELAASMEEVLENYARHMTRFPVVCMDEQPVQLLKETRVPIAATRVSAATRGLRTRAGVRVVFAAETCPASRR
jgi:hypothetical protein